MATQEKEMDAGDPLAHLSIPIPLQNTLAGRKSWQEGVVPEGPSWCHEHRRCRGRGQAETPGEEVAGMGVEQDAGLRSCLASVSCLWRNEERKEVMPRV